MTETMAAAKFEVGDTVRFIGTDKLYTVMHYRKDKHIYQVQCGDDAVSGQWVPEVYLERADSNSTVPLKH